MHRKSCKPVFSAIAKSLKPMGKSWLRRHLTGVRPAACAPMPTATAITSKLLQSARVLWGKNDRHQLC